MITRIFRVRVPAALISEFEPKFQSISYEALAKAPGCLKVTIGKEVSESGQTYVMISEWESQQALIDFAGANWREPHIPAGMEKYAADCSVEHFEIF